MNIKELLRQSNWEGYNAADFPVEYSVISGSISYGCSGEGSDEDHYGFCIPPKSYVYPEDYIYGYGSRPRVFDQHVNNAIIIGDSKFDITVFSIVKFFDLAVKGNPQTIEALFSPPHLIEVCGEIGAKVIDNKSSFLSSGMIPRFTGFARSEYYRLYNEFQKGNMEPKKLYHCIRLLLELYDLINFGQIMYNVHSSLLKQVKFCNNQADYHEFVNMACSLIGSCDALNKRRDLFQPQIDAERKCFILLKECLEMHYASIK